MQEKRKHTRVKIRSLNVQCKMHFDTEVKLLNMSLSGACIALTKPLEMGSEYTLHIACGERTLTQKADVIWARIAGSQRTASGDVLPRYEVGLNFKAVLSGHGSDILHFIEENVTLKPSRMRLKGLRVKVMKPEITSRVEDRRNFNIIKISEGGMLLETDQRFETESTLRMEIFLPHEAQAIKFVGRVASCSMLSDKMSVCYGTGIEFIEMNEVDKAKLKKFIMSVRSY